MKKVRNICFLISCIIYEAIAMAVLHISSDSPNNFAIGLFSFIAVALAFSMFLRHFAERKKAL